MLYRITCARCAAHIVTSEQVGEAEAAAIERHLRAAHPASLPDGQRADFARLLGYVRVRMVD